MSTKFVFKIFIAIVVGELLLVLLTTLAQEVLVDGVHLYKSSLADMIIGGGATLLAGAVSGFTAAFIAGQSVKIPHAIISILIVVETTYLILSNKVSGPLWFDIISALLLIGSVWVGYYLYLRLKR
ncbi:hypothetical protein NA63_2013 [Flavobacteriaceae bacterium MAR_2010_105]|nr:hypothetical protein NA63_2013 [Flavobacteriaceae bacterium MAR_2010_105]